MFVAARHLKIQRDGELIDVGPGDPVPEASTWSHDTLLRCMKVGQIVNVAETDKVDADTAPLAAVQHAKNQTAKPKARTKRAS